MPKYSPKPGESLTLFGRQYTFQEHPGAPDMVFGQEGGRGFVYQVKSADGTRYGLKVFHRRFRVERLVGSSRQLNLLEIHRGLFAAKRWIVLPEDPVAKANPELTYAVLMPWVPGKTWYDCLGRAGSHGALFSLDQAKNVGSTFLSVMESLERNSIAHTDISSGNVMVDAAPQAQAQLLDLEDIYMPDAPEPKDKTYGTAHYQHQGARSTWKPEGDRYATGVLATEILLLANEPTARKATTAGYFEGTCLAPGARLRFEEAKDWLSFAAPDFAKIFERTWYSDTLENCPKIAELQRAFVKERPVKIPTPSVVPEGGWGEWVAGGATEKSAAAAAGKGSGNTARPGTSGGSGRPPQNLEPEGEPGSAGAPSSWGSWQPNVPFQWTGRSAGSTAGQAGSGGGATHPQPTPTAPRPDLFAVPAQGPSRAKKWMIAAAILLAIIIALAVLSSR
jgi:hypothetical protein